MQTWKLSPAQNSLAQWMFSRYRGETIVRAKTEQKARQITAEYFLTNSAGSIPIAHNPWVCSVAVLCQPLVDSGYDNLNEEESVLSPRLPRSYL